MKTITAIAALTVLAMSTAAAHGQEGGETIRVTPVVKAYRKASPAVVNISTQRLVRTVPRMFGWGDDPFEDFMSDIFGRTVPAVSLGQLRRA